MDTEAPITIESLKALIKGIAENQVETDRIVKETALQMKETDRRMQETDRQFKETKKLVDKLSKMYGGLSSNFGSYAEEYFFNSFDEGKQNFFGENFDSIRRNYTDNQTGEYDIMMINGKAVAIIETKFKARESSVADTLKKAFTFRKNFPQYQSHKLYIGLAAVVFEANIEQECKDEGLVVIKQVGDTVVINDTQLKVF
jgi:hypothetical protein